MLFTTLVMQNRTNNTALRGLVLSLALVVLVAIVGGLCTSTAHSQTPAPLPSGFVHAASYSARLIDLATESAKYAQLMDVDGSHTSLGYVYFTARKDAYLIAAADILNNATP